MEFNNFNCHHKRAFMGNGIRQKTPVSVYILLSNHPLTILNTKGIGCWDS